MSIEEPKKSITQRLKCIVIGGARDPHDQHLFHKLSLIAFFAWVGLGADGLSSSCYGPEEAFRALGSHTYLGIFVALATAITIFVISASYSQIIELFPSGGGGYLVASKLLSPSVGMIAGCALLIDYVLTISLSVSSGAAAILSIPAFHISPGHFESLKLTVAVIGVVGLTILNLRGVKESVMIIVPIFLLFIFTHGFAILYSIITHLINIEPVIERTALDVNRANAELGFLGMGVLILRAYSMGAGTFTGIEAVSNGMTILREPRVQTGKRTMRYMAISLAVTVMGLMIAYLLYQVEPVKDKTLNAILFGHIITGWNPQVGVTFVFITLFSAAGLLFVAAQTGFIDGPRVLANMALDRWFPTRFANLSDRFAMKNGILIMGTAALITVIMTKASVDTMVVLYSINVFITFCLSQSGMVRHWQTAPRGEPHRYKKMAINGIGLILCLFILVMVIVLKFREGGWITLVVTGGLVGVALLVRNHYSKAYKMLGRLNSLVTATEISEKHAEMQIESSPFDPKEKTAVLLVNGFSGLGLHTLFSVLRMFKGTFKNFIFVQVGVLDAGTFKGTQELENLNRQVNEGLAKYVRFMERHGYHAEAYSSIGNDIVEEVSKLATRILAKYSDTIFFGGQLVFEEESFATRLLHNYAVFSVQRRLYRRGVPFFILPVRV